MCFGQFDWNPYCVIPAWSAGIQVDTDVSGRILHAGHPCRHDEIFIFYVLYASVS